MPRMKRNSQKQLCSVGDESTMTTTGDYKNVATEQEIEWALRIKQAAKLDPEVIADMISDLEFLQHGIVAKENYNLALRRLKRMQEFKLMYGIQLDGSLEQAARDIEAFFLANPGLYLGLGEASNGVHFVCADYSKSFACKLDTNESYAIRLRGLFYYLQAAQPNVSAMRNGYSTMVDMKHASWRNFSPAFVRRYAQLVSHAYPIRTVQTILLNSHFIIMLGYHLVKIFFSAKARRRFVICGRGSFEEATGGCYTKDVLPREWGGTFDSSQENLKKVWLQRLKERYALAETFRLVAPPSQRRPSSGCPTESSS